MLKLRSKTWCVECGSSSGDAPAAYDVEGLPSDMAVEIAEMHHRWQVLVIRDGIAGDWQGDFDSADAALAALDAEVSMLRREPD